MSVCPSWNFAWGGQRGSEEVGTAVVRNVRSYYEVRANETEEDTTDNWHAHGFSPL
jgi:hypothetical protein